MAFNLKIFDADFTPIQLTSLGFQFIHTVGTIIWDDVTYYYVNRNNRNAITPWTLRDLREGSVLCYHFGNLSTSSTKYTIKELILVDDKCYVFRMEHENKNYTMLTTFYHYKIYRYWKIISY